MMLWVLIQPTRPDTRSFKINAYLEIFVDFKKMQGSVQLAEHWYVIVRYHGISILMPQNANFLLRQGQDCLGFCGASSA